MFTIKHFADGALRVYSCLGYERDRDRPSYILLRHPPASLGEPKEISIARDDEVYIENLAGKTIDLIRPPR
jgi:hypothetical protein